MARLPELLKFARKHKLKIATIASLIEYRRTREKLVERIETIKMPTDYGDFDLTLYRSKLDGQNHLALVRGEHLQQLHLARGHVELDLPPAPLEGTRVHRHAAELDGLAAPVA